MSIKPKLLIIAGLRILNTGNSSPTFGLTRWSDLPKEAQKYISTIEELIQTKISVVSTGPERTQTIDRENIL